MGAMASLGVMVVVDKVVGVYIVVAEGQLAVDVDPGTLGPVADVQLIPDTVDLCLIQQVQALHIGLKVHPSLFGLLLQGVPVGIGVHGLMVRVNAGVNDGDAASRAGVAAGPGQAGADHLRRRRHVGIRLQILLHHRRLISGFDHHILDPGNIQNLLDLSVFHIGGDGVGSQSHVPGYLQLLAGGSFNPGLHLLLLLGQGLAVAHGLDVGRHILAVKPLQGGRRLQKNGHTDLVCILIEGLTSLQRFHLLAGSGIQLRGNRAGVYFVKGQILRSGCGTCHCSDRKWSCQDHGKYQQER